MVLDDKVYFNVKQINDSNYNYDKISKEVVPALEKTFPTLIEKNFNK